MPKVHEGEGGRRGAKGCGGHLPKAGLTQTPPGLTLGPSDFLTPTDNFVKETLRRYVTTPKFFGIRNMKVPTREVSSQPQGTGTQTLNSCRPGNQGRGPGCSANTPYINGPAPYLTASSGALHSRSMLTCNHKPAGQMASTLVPVKDGESRAPGGHVTVHIPASTARREPGPLPPHLLTLHTF